MNPERRIELAGEYSLGVLTGEELAQARSLIATDPEFAAEVAAWSGRLAPLLDEIEPVTPPQRVFAAIEQSLGGRQEANDNSPDIRRKLNLWRSLAVGASAIAASLALVILVAPRSVEPDETLVRPATPPLVATMEAEGSEARVVATWDAGDQSLVLAAAAGLAPVAGRSHELWVIPADGTPRSMGLIPGTDPLHLRVAPPIAQQLTEGATLAVSLEQTGGSPTGAPTGPVVAAGKLERT